MKILHIRYEGWTFKKICNFNKSWISIKLENFNKEDKYIKNFRRDNLSSYLERRLCIDCDFNHESITYILLWVTKGIFLFINLPTWSTFNFDILLDCCSYLECLYVVIYQLPFLIHVILLKITSLWLSSLIYDTFCPHHQSVLTITDFPSTSIRRRMLVTGSYSSSLFTSCHYLRLSTLLTDFSAQFFSKCPVNYGLP